MKRLTNKILLAACVGGFITLISCGGGGGGANIPSNPTAPSSTPAPVVAVNPTSPTVGTPFTVTVTIPSSLNPLQNAGLKLSFDTTDIDIVGVVPGTGTVPYPVFDKVTNVNVTTSGNIKTIDMGFYHSSGATWTGVNGTLCTFTFNALSSGTTTIDFVDDSDTAYCFDPGGCYNQTLPDTIFTINL